MTRLRLGVLVVAAARVELEPPDAELRVVERHHAPFAGLEAAARPAQPAQADGLLHDAVRVPVVDEGLPAPKPNRLGPPATCARSDELSGSAVTRRLAVAKIVVRARLALRVGRADDELALGAGARRVVPDEKVAGPSLVDGLAELAAVELKLIWLSGAKPLPESRASWSLK